MIYIKCIGKLRFQAKPWTAPLLRLGTWDAPSCIVSLDLEYRLSGCRWNQYFLLSATLFLLRTNHCIFLSCVVLVTINNLFAHSVVIVHPWIGEKFISGQLWCLICEKPIQFCKRNQKFADVPNLQPLSAFAVTMARQILPCSLKLQTFSLANKLNINKF